MAKNLIKLCLQASLVCCLIVGFSAPGAGFKSGFETAFYGEFSLSASEPLTSDADTSDVWLHSLGSLVLPVAWGIFILAGLASLLPATIRHLKPIRAPPAQR